MLNFFHNANDIWLNPFLVHKHDKMFGLHLHQALCSTMVIFNIIIFKLFYFPVPVPEPSSLGIGDHLLIVCQSSTEFFSGPVFFSFSSNFSQEISFYPRRHIRFARLGNVPTAFLQVFEMLLPDASDQSLFHSDHHGDCSKWKCTRCTSCY